MPLGWRATLMVLGALGLGLTCVVAVVVREPRRGWIAASEKRAVGDTTRPNHLSVRQTLRTLLAMPPFPWLLVGASCNVFAASVMLGWSPAFMARVHGMAGASAGAWLGAAAGVGGLAGTLLGGSVAQRLARSDNRWWLGVAAASSALAAPMLVLFLTLPAGYARWAAFGVLFFGPAMLGPMMTVTQGLAAPGSRAFAAALVALVHNLLGWGLGPVSVGALSDALTPRAGSESLRYAMGLGVIALLVSAAAFARGSRLMRGVELH